MKFVIIANPWAQGLNNPTSKHHIGAELVRAGHEVLWFNGTGMRRPTMTRWSDVKRALQKVWACLARHRVQTVESGGLTPIVVNQLTVPLPHSRLVRRINASRYMATAKRMFGDLSDVTLLNFLPVFSELQREWPGRSVYYCVDRWDAFAMYDSKLMVELDKACCCSSDVVFASSRDLRDRCRKHNNNTHLITHGVSYDHFAAAVNGDLSKPLDLPDGKIIGFFGLISEWVDQELLVRLAKEIPEANIVLIGKADVDVEALRKVSNIYMLGSKSFAELPSYAACFNVGIIPFVVNDLTKAVNPIKLREMLAAGCPVVSTNLPEVVVSFDKVGKFQVAESCDDFVEAVRAIVANPLPIEDRMLISESVADEDWVVKTMELIDLVGRLPRLTASPIGHKLRYVPYPPTSLPIRDLFVLGYVPFDRQSSVMEIGVGSGETCARLGLECKKVLGVDASDAGVRMIEYLKERYDNLEFLCVDAISDVDVGERFDFVVSCDTLEHVSDPKRFFAFVARHLKPGGEAHILFPNELPNSRHGVTGFFDESSLRDAIGGSIFYAEDKDQISDKEGLMSHARIDGDESEGRFADVEVFRADLAFCSRFVVFISFVLPKKVMHLLKRESGDRRPQRFDETNFFKYANTWTNLAPLINLYWLVVLRLCRITGEVYRLRPVRGCDFHENCSLYVKLRGKGNAVSDVRTAGLTGKNS